MGTVRLQEDGSRPVEPVLVFANDKKVSLSIVVVPTGISSKEGDFAAKAGSTGTVLRMVVPVRREDVTRVKPSPK